MAKLIINDKDGNVLYSHPSVDEIKLAKLKGVYPFEADVVMAANWETTDPIVVQMSNTVTGKINRNLVKRYQDIVNLANSSAPVFAAPPASGGGMKHFYLKKGGIDWTQTTVPWLNKSMNIAQISAALKANSLHFVEGRFMFVGGKTQFFREVEIEPDRVIPISLTSSKIDFLDIDPADITDPNTRLDFVK